MISSKLQTKLWRLSQEWYRGGKSNECEKYQESLLKGIGYRIRSYPGIRFNISSGRMKIAPRPSSIIEYTEDFDFYCFKKGRLLLFNLKMICESGGAQTRSLREVHHFIRLQAEYILRNNNSVHFVNILDGSFCYKHIDVLRKLAYFTSRIFIGDLEEFSRHSFL